MTNSYLVEIIKLVYKVMNIYKVFMVYLFTYIIFWSVYIYIYSQFYCLIHIYMNLANLIYFVFRVIPIRLIFKLLYKRVTSSE